MANEKKQTKRARLYDFLYKLLINEDCDSCYHMTTYTDDNSRHACNRCEFYDRFKIREELKAELKEKVNEIIEITKE